MHKGISVSICDLRYICIQCPQCKTRVILDMKERSAVAEKHDFFAPMECPGCRGQYDSALRETIDKLQKLYGPLGKIADRISFLGDEDKQN